MRIIEIRPHGSSGSPGGPAREELLLHSGMSRILQIQAVSVVALTTVTYMIKTKVLGSRQSNQFTFRSR
jgi:hypothetical protein